MNILAPRRVRPSADLQAGMRQFDQMISALIHWHEEEALIERFGEVEQTAREMLASIDDLALAEFEALEPPEVDLAEWRKQARGERIRMAWYCMQYHKVFARAHQRIRGRAANPTGV